jgi:glutamate-1-semialdehyde aminotransferase
VVGSVSRTMADAGSSISSSSACTDMHIAAAAHTDVHLLLYVNTDRVTKLLAIAAVAALVLEPTVAALRRQLLHCRCVPLYY